MTASQVLPKYKAALTAAAKQARLERPGVVEDDELVTIYVRNEKNCCMVVVEFKKELRPYKLHTWFHACRDRSRNRTVRALQDPEGFSFIPR